LHGWTFDAAQVELARSFVCDDRLLVAGVGPAGTGKTTAMQLTAAALDLDGRALVALAPSARAAGVLGAEVGVPATTIAKVLHAHDQAVNTGVPVPAAWALRPGDVVLVDEASMVDQQLAADLLETGVIVVASGDPGQLHPVKGQAFFDTPDFTLTEIRRQAADSPIIRQAHRVRAGQPYENDGDAFHIISERSDENYDWANCAMLPQRNPPPHQPLSAPTTGYRA
jgi:ATP-dependent exoDNAse (exonuclease V) alpha subunit